MTARLVSASDKAAVFALELRHVQGTEREGFYCWCSPIIEAIEHAWVVIHNADKERYS